MNLKRLGITIKGNKKARVTQKRIDEINIKMICHIRMQ